VKFNGPGKRLPSLERILKRRGPQGPGLKMCLPKKGKEQEQERQRQPTGQPFHGRRQKKPNFRKTWGGGGWKRGETLTCQYVLVGQGERKPKVGWWGGVGRGESEQTRQRALIQGGGKETRIGFRCRNSRRVNKKRESWTELAKGSSYRARRS